MSVCLAAGGKSQISAAQGWLDRWVGVFLVLA